MKSREPTKLHRKSGVWGTRRWWRGWSSKRRLFDVGGSFFETTKGCWVVLDPELGVALL
jgi:hypothetical protein